MAGTQFGLQVAFYLYLCGLFTTLLTSQSIQYFRSRRRRLRNGAGSDDNGDGRIRDAKAAAAVDAFYARLLRATQSLLTILLLPGIILVVRQGVLSRHDSSNFPFSTYLAVYVGVLLY